MELGHVFSDSLDTSNGKRPLDEEKIKTLMESIKELGLQNPVHVWASDDTSAQIVAGRHRAEACRRLGWDEIPCVFVEMDAIKREMWEIAENLHRAELTKEQRDEHIRRYAELIEMEEKKEEEVSGQIVQKPKSGPKGGRPKETASKVADKTGLSQRTVRRALNKPTVDPQTKDAQKEADRQRREQDKAVKIVAAEEYAEWLLRQIDLDQLPILISWIEASPPRDLIAALRRLSDEAPTMDQRYGT